MLLHIRSICYLHRLPMLTVFSLRRFPYEELASSGAIHDALTHSLLRFGHQTPRHRSQRGMQGGISTQTK